MMQCVAVSNEKNEGNTNEMRGLRRVSVNEWGEEEEESVELG